MGKSRIDELLPDAAIGPKMMMRAVFLPSENPKPVYNAAWAAGVDLAVKNGWRDIPAGKELIRNLARIAVDSALTGTSLSDEQIIRITGLEKYEWLLQWQYRYIEIRSVINEWHEIALNGFTTTQQGKTYNG